MNDSICKDVFTRIEMLEYKIDEIKFMVQYINDSHEPFNRSLNEISLQLKQDEEHLSETRRMLRRYMDEEGFNGEHSSMAIVGRFNTGFSMYIQDNDNGIRPHFHMKKNDTYVCIEFERPEYFRQGEEHEGGFLDDEEKKELIENLQAVINIEKFKEAGITSWEMLCLTWNWNNPDKELPDDLEMPDYSLL